MTATTVSPNGRVRRSLATEIDRLNQILDGLADGLTDAVREAVQQAIQLALREVLASPAFLEQLREKIVPPDPAPAQVETPVPPKKEEPPSRGSRLLGWVGAQAKAVAAGCAASARAIGRAGMALLRPVRTVATLGRRGAVRGLELASAFGLLALRLARQYRLPLLTAAGIGTALGLAAFGAGRLTATLLCRLGDLLTAVRARAGRWLRRLLGREPWQGAPVLATSAC